MDEEPDSNQWRTLDKDLKRFGRLELSGQLISRPLIAPGAALVFIALACAAAAAVLTPSGSSWTLIAAAGVGAYMALNIGANDVANNVGPAVGARVLTMGGALLIAAAFESLGAVIAGGDVVATISGGIVGLEGFDRPQVFMHAMIAAMIGAAIWVNLSTWLGAPVSTTHAIVGGVLGAGLAGGGLGVVNWAAVATIALGWVASPVMGGAVAAALLWFLQTRIKSAEDPLDAGRRWTPALVAMMAGVFAAYLSLKAVSHLVPVRGWQALAVGLGVGLATWLVLRPLVARRSAGMENRPRSMKALFRLPLAVSAALLSFAHGANDVANVVGPLAAIARAAQEGAVDGSVAPPAWVMAIGALGISLGLLLFGPRLVRMVGDEITKLSPPRAWCVAMSAATTVILASWMGLPVSSTHVAIGGVFGVGFLREHQEARRAREAAQGKQALGHPPEERSRRKLVRRSHFLTILAAWVVTAPAAGLISAGVLLASGPLLR
ncbi:inorganic phosphate transporter [Albimonas sp. CAU 1670]|uniref:inorganic phosphate transporter n=1 Tax=Albimonas sp. CAU 1670 TaxID=3032599 RepID=UPI0023DCA037|nr:inorganic phosphate transporter [Albimonas sp. CAU 1670]MDF2231819.1 inorganic phosphate transporter [Albimonas sp. CAU 1670]